MAVSDGMWDVVVDMLTWSLRVCSVLSFWSWFCFWRVCAD